MPSTTTDYPTQSPDHTSEADLETIRKHLNITQARQSRNLSSLRRTSPRATPHRRRKGKPRQRHPQRNQNTPQTPPRSSNDTTRPLIHHPRNPHRPSRIPRHSRLLGAIPPPRTKNQPRRLISPGTSSNPVGKPSTPPRSKHPLVRVELADGNTGWGESNTPIAPEIVCVMIDARHRRDGDQPGIRFPNRTLGFRLRLPTRPRRQLRILDGRTRRNRHRHLGRLRKTQPCTSSLTPRLPTQNQHPRLPLRSATRHARRARHSGKIPVRPRSPRREKSSNPATSKPRSKNSTHSSTAHPTSSNGWSTPSGCAPSTTPSTPNANSATSQPPLLRMSALQPEDIARHRTLHRSHGSPIAIGEHFRTTYQLNDWLTPEPVFDVYQPDIGRTSISDFIRQRDLAYANNIPVTPHMGNGVSVFQAATLQCAAVSSPELLQEFQGGLSNLLQDASDTGWQLTDGAFQLPDRPGLGVTIDENGIEPYIVRR